MTDKIRLHIVADNIRSAYNIGSLFRTADATGSAKIYLCGISPTPENPKVAKTSLGAELVLPWEYLETTELALKKLIQLNIPIVAVETDQESKDFRLFKYPEQVALVFGHEKTGINDSVLSLCNEVVHIPMLGQKESLNVATAAGIVMFEAIRYKYMVK